MKNVRQDNWSWGKNGEHREKQVKIKLQYMENIQLEREIAILVSENSESQHAKTHVAKLLF